MEEKERFLEYVKINQYLQEVVGLDKSDSIQLAKLGVLKRYKEGQSIFASEKEYKATFYMIFSGGILLKNIVYDGDCVCQLYFSNQYFPASLEVNQRCFEIQQAIACKSSEILMFPLNKIKKLSEDNSKMSLFLFNCLAKKSYETLELEKKLLSGSRKKRMGALFLLFAQKWGRKLEDGNVLLPKMLTHSVMESLTYSGHTIIDDVIADFKQEGLLFNRTSRIVLNGHMLKRLENL